MNYLEYSTLDEALASQKVHCAIPTSFTWHHLVGGDYVAKTFPVKLDAGNCDADPTQQKKSDANQGQSVTQDIGHYTVRIRNTVVRLIDTPGIGDARGVSQDSEIMGRILESLGRLNTLAGIVILLKPSEARLTGLVLGPDTTYYFDSEAFQFLAAYCRGVKLHDMGMLKDNRASWNKSKAEAIRMLEHFRPSVTAPHRTIETTDLHWSRCLMLRLATASQEISFITKSKIDLYIDEKQKLRDTLVRCEELAEVQRLTEMLYETDHLDVPCTVCSHPDCNVVKDGQEQYKSVCHDPCKCADIPAGERLCKSIVQCKVFRDQNGVCKPCGHSWGLHMRVIREAPEPKMPSEDSAVARRHEMHVQSAGRIKEMISARRKDIDRYTIEHEAWQALGRHLVGIIRRDAIKPWNGSTLRHLDCLISTQRDQVQAGGSDKQLKQLLADRHQHEEDMAALKTPIDETNGVLDAESLKLLSAQFASLEVTRSIWEGIHDSHFNIESPLDRATKSTSAVNENRHGQDGEPNGARVYGVPNWHESRWAH
ncbi:hypothetical protein PRZ48_013186 [Zasmidium cellare]|uniref:DUF8206 domain-containing protein n=1 Tax=Zasmidium cellare TaxID=395010 RepID=A0ABR0E3B7_ZASCE|nr:hypothetical protein PRZ48_013186 [Zasmidium cellare]